MIREMIKSPTHIDAVKNYVHALLARKENQCIRKTNMRANYSKIHVGNNHWQLHPDQTLYPKLMANIASEFCDLVQGQSSQQSTSREKIIERMIEKIIPFLDYMAGEGYCNSDNQSKVRNILQNFRELVRELKFIVCNNTLNC